MDKPFHTYPGPNTAGAHGYPAQRGLVRQNSSTMYIYSALDGVEMKLAETITGQKVTLPLSMPNAFYKPDLEKYNYDFSFEYKVLESNCNGV